LNIPGNRRSPAPILLVHGMADEVAPPIGTKEILSRALKSGDTIKVSWYPNENHRSVIAAARLEILAWFADCVKGRPAPTDGNPSTHASGCRRCCNAALTRESVYTDWRGRSGCALLAQVQ
jgi:hypothetical protein